MSSSVCAHSATEAIIRTSTQKRSRESTAFFIPPGVTASAAGPSFPQTRLGGESCGTAILCVEVDPSRPGRLIVYGDADFAIAFATVVITIG